LSALVLLQVRERPSCLLAESDVSDNDFSSIPTWSVGDPVIVGAEVRYHILGIAYDKPRDVTSWTAEPVPSGHWAAA
jgi:hypothetical protein